MARLGGEQGLPPEMLDDIVARTDGVPLFVEELTKAVLETGTTRRAPAVPASLHASLMARLDRMPEVKEVAQIAACIGREFDYPLLAAVSPVPEPELRSALDRLAAAELVFRAASRRRRATSSSTRWSRTRPTRACSRAGGSSCTPASPRCWRSASRRRRRPSRSCWPTTTPRRGSPSRRSATGTRPGGGRSRARRWPRRWRS